MGRHRLRESEYEGRPGGGFTAGVKMVKTEYSEDELAARSRLRGDSSDLETQVGSRNARPKTAFQPHWWGWTSFLPKHLYRTALPYRASPAGLHSSCRFAALWRARSAGRGLGVWCVQDGKTPNGRRLPLHDERWEAAGKYGSVGWHTFPPYLSFLAG